MKRSFLMLSGARSRCALLLVPMVLSWWFVSVPLSPAAAGEQDLVIRIIEKQKAVQTLSAEFTQEKHSALLAAPMVSKGRFHYKAPDKVAWIYPDQVLIVSDGSDLTVYYPELKEAEIVPVQKSIIRLPLSFNIEEFSRHFEVRAVSARGGYAVTLVPLDSGSLFETIIIVLSTEGFPRTVEMKEKAGDRSIITFRNQKVNAPLPETTFRLMLPEGTIIRRYRPE